MNAKNRFIPGLVMCMLLVLLSCAKPPAETGLDPFPVERSAAEFTGVSYPVQDSLPVNLRGPVWVVGVDGASWDLIRPMADRGELPNFAALMEASAHGVLLSEEPMISPALWATIATGAPRFAHGVVNFMAKLPGFPDATPVGPPDRRYPAIWELVGAAGGSSAVVSWFGSFPAEQIEGYYVSKDCDPEAPQSDQVYPPEFADVIREEADIRMPSELFRAIGKTQFLQDAVIEDMRTLAVLRTIVEQSGPDSLDLVVAYFSGIDVVQHVAWRDMDPTTPSFPGDEPADPNRADVIPAYYRLIDETLGHIREMMPPDASLVVLSDHGAGPTDLQEAFRLRLEVVLEQLGLMGEGAPLLAIDEFYRHDKRIWINIEGVEQGGSVPADQAPQIADEVAERLEALRTDTGHPVFESIVNHMASTSWKPGEPALTVRFAPEVLLAEEVQDGKDRFAFDQVRLRKSDVSGSHRLEGILLVDAPGVRRGPFAESANLYQIAPLVLQLLGLPQDAGMLAVAPPDGGVPMTLFEGQTVDPAVTMVTRYPGTDRSGKLRTTDSAEIDGELRDATLEKLRNLGYVN